MSIAATTNGAGTHADVLIIGAGASGGLAAARLAREGFSVTCLEQGDWTSASDYPGGKLEYELLAGKDWHPNPNVRDRPADYPLEVSDSDVNPLMFNGVGGTTIIWAAHWARHLPSDFFPYTLDGVADDWPFSYEDLLPYYQRVEKEMGVSGLGGDPAFPDGAEMPLPPFPIHKMGRKAAQGMNELGWHWWPAPNAMPSNGAYGNLQQCVRRGTCLSGCPNGAKATSDLVHWPAAIADGAKVVTGARVRQITMENGLASGAIWIDRDGAEHHQTADVVIVGANGIGTPRLLLLSATADQPDGLANSSGLVGKRLMMHPYAAVSGFYDDELESWLGPAGQTVHSLEFFETDESRGFTRGGKWQVMPMGGLMGMRSAWGGAALDEQFGEALHRNVREQLGHGFEWGITAEDLPDLANAVTLDPALTDGDGIPAPKITYKMSGNTHTLMGWMVERAEEAHQASGAKRTLATPLLRDSGGHLMGTCKMGDDPETSVVDGHGRSHDVSNLYIYDGSVFPSSSSCNPTATILAVALRGVEHLIASRNLQEVPA